MGVVQDLLAWGRMSRLKPQYGVPTNNERLRSTVSQDLCVRQYGQGDQALCDEGSLFTATNPTPGTPIAYGSAGTQASFSDTVPFMQVLNTSANDANATIVFLRRLKLTQIGGTAPASTTSVSYVVRTDNGFRASTAGTPNTVTPTASNQNISSTKSVSSVVYYSGAVATIPALTAAGRQPVRGLLKGGPTLLLDEYNIAFGSPDSLVQGGYLTTVAQYTTRSAAVGIGPGQSATIYLYLPGAATNPFSYEFELELEER